MSKTTNHDDRTSPELDALLREWHDVNADHAAEGRDRLVQRLRESRRAERLKAAEAGRPGPFAVLGLFIQRLAVNRYAPALASLTFLVVIVALLVPRPGGTAYAAVTMVAEGGRLEALDGEGNMLGACPLAHTDVDVRVSGFMSRVDVTQTYTNPYDKKIEAVYTFPLSHRAAVDRMTITVGDRVVVGEVKERELARRIYEAARKQGYVAGLLEQQRPNIFTQSVANIEPGAEVVVRIGYVEMLTQRNGTYTFDFPMVVGPRYIPGAPVTSPSFVPAELQPRAGLILLGPANMTVGAAGNTTPGTLQAGKLNELIAAAQPVKYPGDAWWGRGDVTGGAGTPDLWYRFEAGYADGSREFGELYTDGTGHVNGRWFYTDHGAIKGMGTGFSRNTSQVPDASLITPQPVKPPTRAGHDVSVTVTIDSGGPGVVDVSSALHEVETTVRDTRDDGNPAGVTVTLANRETIPNRDFVLSWRQTADTIEEATFTHTSDTLGDWSGGFFTLIVQPPDQVVETEVPPRELIFVMDTSGSMSGFPIEKSKAVMTRAIDAMRPADTFNVITFAGHTAILWNTPQPATADNRAEATAFVKTRRGGGGTEMMKAIDAALVQGPRPGPLTPRTLLDLPADGRHVEITVPYENVHVTGQPGAFRIPIDGDLEVQLRLDGDLPTVFSPHGVTLRFDGRWSTVDGRRVLLADRVSAGRGADGGPMRLVLFLTDGYVGNDMAIIDAVRRNARTTRVFSFGIGNSVNRYLLDGMAKAGRGESEFVLLDTDADEAVERFTTRIETPVLTDITMDFSDGLQVTDMLPAPDAIPDLFDAKPLVIHGRYTEPGKGTVTIRGRTGAGPYERVVELDLPETAADHDVIATLWARAKVDGVLDPNLEQVQLAAAPQTVKDEVVALGEQFSIMTPFTSFVAVEKSRLTIDGEPVLVAVPIELPDGVAWEGVFGNEVKELDIVGGWAMRTHEDHRKLQSTGSLGANGRMTNGMYFYSVDGVAPVDGQGVPVGIPPGIGGEKLGAPGKGGGGFGGGGGSGGGFSSGTAFGGSAPADAPAPGRRDKGAGKRSAPRRSTVAEAPPPTAPASGSAPAAQSKKDSADAAEPMRKIEKSAEVKESLADTETAKPNAGAAVELDALNAPVEEPEVVLADRAGEREEEFAGDTFKQTLEQEQQQRARESSPYSEIGQQDPGAASTERNAQLGRVLHAALRNLTIDHDRAAATEDRKNRVAGEPGGVMVTVLISGVSDAAVRDALSEAGLSIKAWSKSLPIVVGTIAFADLQELALVPGVRRIELTRMVREAR